MIFKKIPYVKNKAKKFLKLYDDDKNYLKILNNRLNNLMLLLKNQFYPNIYIQNLMDLKNVVCF